MTFQHIVTSKEAQERIDKILTTLNEHISRSQIQTWIKNQYVTVNNTYVKANYKCQQGDIIKWSLPAKEKISLTPRSIPRSEEHTSELQSRFDLVCRLLLE